MTAFIATSVAGFLLQKELDYLQGAVDVPKRPFAAIVGGSKVSSKISVIEAMLSKVSQKGREGKGTCRGDAFKCYCVFSNCLFESYHFSTLFKMNRL